MPDGKEYSHAHHSAVCSGYRVGLYWWETGDEGEYLWLVYYNNSEDENPRKQALRKVKELCKFLSAVGVKDPNQ